MTLPALDLPRPRQADSPVRLYPADVTPDHHAVMENDTAIAARLDAMRLRNLAPTTIRVNRDHLYRLARFLAPVPLLDATPDDLMRWARHLLPLTPRTRFAELSRTHGFYRWAADEGLREDIPSARLPRPKVPRALPRPISEERLQVALNGAPADVRTWLILAAWAGLRCCEIAALTRDQVLDTADPPVLIVTGKGAKDRIIPLHPRVRLALYEWGLSSRGYVFRRRDGHPGPPTADRVSWLCNRWLHESGVPDTMHSLRHRAVTGVYRACRDIRVAQEFAGHSSPDTTAGYAAHAPDRLAAAVLALA